MDNCQICGSKIEQGKYKPKLYCSDECRNYIKYKNALEKILLVIKFTKEAKKIIRGDMFRLSNSVGNGTNTIKVKDND